MHFKQLTSLTPGQFQQRLRLIEARRLMHAEGCTASQVAFTVGYQSVPQFTREYARLFGAPPRRHLAGSAEMALPRRGGSRSRLGDNAGAQLRP